MSANPDQPKNPTPPEGSRKIWSKPRVAEIPMQRTGFSSPPGSPVN